MTTFDSLIQNNQLQMIKAAIPYISSSPQKALSIYVKMIEFLRTVTIMNQQDSQLMMSSLTPENTSQKTIAMLTDIRPFCSSKQQDNIDMLLDFFQMYDTCETLFN